MDLHPADPVPREVLDLIRSSIFTRGDAELFRLLVDNPLYHHPYLALADFDACSAGQGGRPGLAGPGALDPHVPPQRGRFGQVLAGPQHPRGCADIWKTPPEPIQLLEQQGCRTRFVQQTARDTR